MIQIKVWVNRYTFSRHCQILKDKMEKALMYQKNIQVLLLKVSTMKMIKHMQI